MKLSIVVLLCAVLMLLAGCVSGGLDIVYPDGTRVAASYARLGTTKVDDLRVERGETRIELHGYQSDGASLAEGVARGVAAGLR